MEKQIAKSSVPSKVIRLFASLALVATMVPALALQHTQQAYAAAPATTEADFGTNLHWALTDSDSDGTWETLTITNKTTTAEAIPDYKSSSSKSAPWNTADNKTAVQKVVIGGHITKLGNYSFNGMAAITDATLGADVKTLGTYVFRNCSKLKQITLNSGTTIGANAFNGCGALESINLEAITAIPDSAFKNCASLKSVDLSKVTSIGKDAFNGCSAIESVDFASAPTVGNTAFQDCKALKEVKNLNKIKSFGTSVFMGCVALESVDLTGFTTIPQGIFSGCTSLKTVSGIDGITAINGNAFQGCTSLTQALYPKVTTVSSYAFAGCTGITTIDFSNAKSIMDFAFQKCTSITSVDLPSIAGDSAVSSCAFSGCTSLTTVKLGSEASEGGKLSSNAFNGCTSLKSVDMTGITSSDGTPFAACAVLTDIKLSQKMTILNGMFKNLPGITEVIVPDTVTQIVNSEFFGCTSLKKVTIGAGVKTIGTQVFANCTSLEEVTISDDNENFIMSHDAIYSKDKKTLVCVTPVAKGNFKVDDACETISAYAFAYCTAIESVDFNNANIETLPANLFYGCSALKNVDLSGVTTLSNNLFQNCTSLERITLPEGIAEIPMNCFNGCTSLKEVKLPSSVKKINTYAFNSCEQLAQINTEAVTNFGMYAFKDCKVLATVDTSSATTFGMYPFKGCAVEELDFSSLSGNITNNYVGNTTNLKSIKLGANTTVTCDSFTTSLREKIEKIEITADNTKYAMFDNNQLLCEIDADKNATKVIMCIGAGTEIVVPETVTTIGSKAFEKNANIEKVTLPANGCVVEQFAFGANTSGHAIGCTKLKEIVNLDKVTSIGNAAFRGATVLKEANVSAATSIGSNAFQSCIELEKVVLNPSGTSIADYAFHECRSLAIPDNFAAVTSLGQWAFYNCISLTGTLTTPAAVTAIPNYCFENCDSLSGLVVSEGVTTVGSYSFDGCSSLGSIELPKTLTKVNQGSFSYCDTVDSVVINGNTSFNYQAPISAYAGSFTGTTAKHISLDAAATYCKIIDNSLYDTANQLLLAGQTSDLSYDLVITDEDIAGGRYAGFDNISSVKIVGATKTVKICRNAFKNCKNIKTVSLSNVIFDTKKDVFKGCTSLETVIFDGSVTDIVGNSFNGGSNFIGCSSFTKYELGADYQGDYTVEDGILYNADKTTVISVPTGLSEVKLASTVTTIGPASFSGNCNMKRFVVPEGVTSIENSAFADVNIEYIKLPSTLWKDKELSSFQKDIDQAGGMFFNGQPSGLSGAKMIANTSLKEIDLSNYGQSYIPPYVFASLGGLESVTLPACIEEIAAGAFFNCINLKNVYSESQTLAVAGAGMTGDSTLGWKSTTPPAFGYENGVLNTAIWKVNENITFVGLAYEQNELYGYANNQGGKFTPYVVLADTDSATLNSMFGSDQGWKSYNTVSVAATNFAKTGKAPSKLALSVKFMDEGFSRTLTQGKDYSIVCLNAAGKEVKNTNAPGTYKLAIKGNGKDVIGLQIVASFKQEKTMNITTSLGKFKANNATDTATFVKLSKKASKAKSITIPTTVKANGRTYKVTSVGSKACYKQNNVTKLTIGKNVKTIKAKAFASCKKLKTVVVKSKSLKKSSFKNLLKSSKIKTVKCVSYAKKASVKAKYKKYAKKYKKSVVVK